LEILKLESIQGKKISRFVDSLPDGGNPEKHRSRRVFTPEEMSHKQSLPGDQELKNSTTQSRKDMVAVVVCL